MDTDLTIIFGFIVLSAISIAFIGTFIYFRIENAGTEKKWKKVLAKVEDEKFNLETLKRILRSIQFVEDCFPKSLPRSQQMEEFYKYDCERWKMQSELDFIKEEIWRTFETWKYKSKKEVSADAVESLDNIKETLANYSQLRKMWQDAIKITTGEASNIEIEKSTESYIEEFIKSLNARRNIS